MPIGVKDQKMTHMTHVSGCASSIIVHIHAMSFFTKLGTITKISKNIQEETITIPRAHKNGRLEEEHVTP